MALSLTVTQVRKVVATGRIYVYFSDGKVLEFKDLQDVTNWAGTIELDAQEGRDLMRKMFARWYLLRDPTGATPSLVEGKTMTFDLGSATPLTVA